MVAVERRQRDVEVRIENSIGAIDPIVLFKRVQVWSSLKESWHLPVGSAPLKRVGDVDSAPLNSVGDVPQDSSQRVLSAVELKTIASRHSW